MPDVFYMHQLQVGFVEAAGRRCFVISNQSRATTGLVFVGMYDENGEILFDAVLPGGEVWDIQKSERGISILGAVSKLDVIVPVVQ